MTRVRSVCPYCGVGCGVLVETRRGRVASVAGDPDHPTNRGGLCSKGAGLGEAVHARDRLLHPMVRPRQGSGFDRSLEPRATGWSEAIAIVAGGIRRALDEHGPDSVAIYLSGQLQTEDYYVGNKLAKGLLGTANVDTNSRLCMASTVAAYKRAFGADAPPGCYEDLDLASHVYLWGSNAALTHPILFGRLQRARQARGQRWTVIDPRRTETAAAGDRHLALLPGTDAALGLAIAAAMFEAGLVDEPAVRQSCEGLDEVREAALAMPPERAAPICGIDAGAIREVARELALAPAALSLWCQGLNQSSAGTDKVSAVINLHLLTGQIGQPGTGPFSLTGQSNAMGGREVGGMATELAAHRAFDDAGARAELERFWGLGPVPKRRGLTALEMIDAAAAGRVRVLWVACTNPVASLPDGRAVREALDGLDLLVVQDIHHPTDTSLLADVLLPAAGWAEKTGTMTSSERRVALAPRAVAPPGEARPDWEIFAAVARELGGGDAFAWPDAAAVFDEHCALTAGRDLDMTALSHARLGAEGPQQWPFAGGGTAQARRYLGGRYATPSGRARLVPVAFRPPAETPDTVYPLRLMTGRDRDAWHTLTRTGKVAALRTSGSEAVVAVGEADAAAAGLAGGDRALVGSARGRLLARVRVDPGLNAGQIFMPFHRGPLHDPAGWTNALVGRALDPVSFQPELKHTAARLERFTGRVAIAGGDLAGAVATRLAGLGIDVRRLSLDQLGDVPPGVWPAHIPGDLDGGPAWWEVAGRPELVPAPPEGGVALLDLTAGPEPLAALPALAAAGWQVRRKGEGGIPAPVLHAVDRALPTAAREQPALVLGGVRQPAGESTPAGVTSLIPGGRIESLAPLSGDPSTLAAYLAGHLRARAALRRVVVPIGSRVLVVAGDPGPQPGATCLIHEDSAAGLAQVWSLTAGEVLGVAAMVERAVADDVERLWLADPEPSVVRARVPLH